MPEPEEIQVEGELLPPDGHKLRETGNGPTVSYEEALLREYFGDPDSDGVYGRGGGDVGA